MVTNDVGVRRGLYQVFSDRVVETILGNDIKQMCDYLDESKLNEDILKKGFSQLINRVFVMAFGMGILVSTVVAGALIYIVIRAGAP
jgi:uncharacterized protein YaaW (UPF0174 family)